MEQYVNGLKEEMNPYTLYQAMDLAPRVEERNQVKKGDLDSTETDPFHILTNAQSTQPKTQTNPQPKPTI